ncbi:uncharacterized protein FIBRA_00289 [Fibroporia radiculosa]|uniref:Ribulose-phosphate 3-epimerase n=1 Tax=Fibroporia radiculosa TaxID=599839 RepID=J7RVB2_9APHY|nr:uncharacterized protein FIBRA_00289 [Fibroporia radiculosa]CCL98295.1 predicted protein [Fibroporia radiculosa]
MPRAIISPSVLASDFGQLTAECKRMIKGGAEWLHMADPLSLIHAIHERKMKAGVAISPDTPSTAITDEVGEAADMLLVMTVYPGRGGQKFLERCVPKVAELRVRFPDKDIEVDGGVGPKTVDVCAEAGSNVIVAGTAIFNAPEPEQVIALLKRTVNDAQAKISSK